MELVNEALIKPDDILDATPSEGLLCLDACKCIGDDFCEAITRCNG